MLLFERPLVVGGSAANQGQRASLLIQPAVKVPTLMDLGIRVIEGVKGGQTSISIMTNEKVTRRDSGCGPFEATGTLLRFAKNSISVDPVEIKLEECTADYVNTVLEAVLKAGHAEDNNLEGTVIETITRKALNGEQLNEADANELDLAIIPPLSDQLTGVTYKDALRIWGLGDRTSADVNYNQTDGIRKKLITKNPTPGTQVPEGVYRGAALPTADELKADPKLVLDVFQGLYDNSTDELQEQDDEQKAWYVDSVIYRALKAAYRLLVAGNQVETSQLAVMTGQNGQKLTYEGIEVIELKFWYKWMRADFPGASPLVIIYTVRENLVFATDLESDMAEVKFWYDINTEFNRTRVKYRIGAGFGFDVLTAFSI